MEEENNSDINIDNNILNWEEKYKPKSINDLIGNKKSIELFIEWLNKFYTEKTKNLKNNNIDPKKKSKAKTKNLKKNNIPEICNNNLIIDDDSILDLNINIDDVKPIKTGKNNYGCILIIGSHGIGKTCIVDVVLNELKYIIHLVNINNIKKISIDVISKFNSKNNNIIDIMNNNISNKHALVIDEIESLTSVTDKNNIINLLKENNIHLYCPIIIISSNQHTKLLSEIKKHSVEIKLCKPLATDMYQIASNIINSEHMNITNPTIIKQIVEQSQYDIRRLLYILLDIHYTYKDIKINGDIIKKYCNISKKKILILIYLKQLKN